MGLCFPVGVPTYGGESPSLREEIIVGLADYLAYKGYQIFNETPPAVDVIPEVPLAEDITPEVPLVVDIVTM